MRKLNQKRSTTVPVFRWNTSYPEMKIKDGQKTAYGYDHGQDVLTTLDTITTIVTIWEMLKKPVESGIRTRECETYG